MDLPFELLHQQFSTLAIDFNFARSMGWLGRNEKFNSEIYTLQL